MARNREQRMQWLERLISPVTEEKAVARALVAEVDGGKLGVAFDQVVEVLAQPTIYPFPLLPVEYCGVVRHDRHLIPILALGGPEDASRIVVIVQLGENRLGLHFHGATQVVDLEATKKPSGEEAEGSTIYNHPSGMALSGTALTDEALGQFLLLDSDALITSLLNHD